MKKFSQLAKKKKKKKKNVSSLKTFFAIAIHKKNFFFRQKSAWRWKG